MTSAAAIFGALPIALGLGAGAGSRRPLGYAIVGGLIVSTLLTLYLVPAVFVVLERLRHRRKPVTRDDGGLVKAERPLVAAHMIALLALLLPASAIAQQDAPMVNLEDARARAAAVNREVVAARGDVDVANWERRSAIADLFTPRISASANYIRFSDPFFNFGTGAISPNATSATLDASYSLIGSGKFSGMKRSRAALASAHANETAAAFRVAFETDLAYFSVLAERELARVTSERLKRAQEQFGLARVRVVAGEAIATDSLQLLLEVNRARLAKLRRSEERRV